MSQIAASDKRIYATTNKEMRGYKVIRRLDRLIRPIN